MKKGMLLNLTGLNGRDGLVAGSLKIKFQNSGLVSGVVTSGNHQGAGRLGGGNRKQTAHWPQGGGMLEGGVAIEREGTAAARASPSAWWESEATT